jgi:hypothetical protein
MDGMRKNIGRKQLSQMQNGEKILVWIHEYGAKCCGGNHQKYRRCPIIESLLLRKAQ